MARGDAVIANSEWTARHILETYRFQPKRIVVIPRGLDLDYFDPSKVEPERIQPLRDWWGAGPGVRVILLPGRLTRWKGQLVFVRALAQLKRKGLLPQDVRAVIAGASQGRASYLKEIVDTIARNTVWKTSSWCRTISTTWRPPISRPTSWSPPPPIRKPSGACRPKPRRWGGP